MFAAKPIGDFVDTHPTLKILALAFLILVGVSLMAESLDIHIPKGYIYFAMGFSAVVEMLNIKMRKITWSLNHIKRRNNVFRPFSHYRIPLPI